MQETRQKLNGIKTLRENLASWSRIQEDETLREKSRQVSRGLRRGFKRVREGRRIAELAAEMTIQQASSRGLPFLVRQSIPKIYLRAADHTEYSA